MKISQKTIDQIFETVILEDVISDFVVLKKSGANYKGLSPFNDEKTPSFVVSPSKEIWKDFSSGKGGNVISFLMEHEQYTYPQALLFLAKKYNIEVEYIELDPEAQKEHDEREATLIVLNFAKNTFSTTLLEGSNIAISYLKQRGFNNAIIKKFELGYVPFGNHKLVLETKKSGYNIKYLHNTRIINNQEKNRFHGRLIFPIHNITGRVVGFGGRVLDKKKKEVKYLNSDSSELYQKSKILYGIHLAKKHIKLLDSCFIVEGYTDVMAFVQFGMKNVVSNCGTALTREQIRLIKRFTNNITLVFDSDKAGILATIKAINLILEQNMIPKVLKLPKDEDPASFMQKNSIDVINEYITKHVYDFLVFKYNLVDQHNTASLIKTTKDIIQSLALIEDRIVRALYLRKASKLLNLQEEDLLLELNNTKSSKHLKKPKLDNSVVAEKINFSEIKKKHLEEFQLIRLLINYGAEETTGNDNQLITFAQFIVEELKKDDIQFKTPLFNKILKHVHMNMSLGSEELLQSSFLSHSDEEIRGLSAYIVGQHHFLSNWQQKDIIVQEEKDILIQVTIESILRFKLIRVQAMVQKALSKLKNHDSSEDDLNQFSRLSKLEKKIQKELGRLF